MINFKLNENVYYDDELELLQYKITEILEDYVVARRHGWKVELPLSYNKNDTIIRCIKGYSHIEVLLETEETMHRFEKQNLISQFKKIDPNKLSNEVLKSIIKIAR